MESFEWESDASEIDPLFSELPLSIVNENCLNSSHIYEEVINDKSFTQFNEAYLLTTMGYLKVAGEEVKCSDCIKWFTNAYVWNRHYQQIHQNVTYSCGRTGCKNLKFNRLYEVKNHTEKYHPKSENTELLGCNKCSILFLGFDLLAFHEEQKHSCLLKRK